MYMIFVFNSGTTRRRPNDGAAHRKKNQLHLSCQTRAADSWCFRMIKSRCAYVGSIQAPLACSVVEVSVLTDCVPLLNFHRSMVLKTGALPRRNALNKCRYGYKRRRRPLSAAGQSCLTQWKTTGSHGGRVYARVAKTGTLP